MQNQDFLQVLQGISKNAKICLDSRKVQVGDIFLAIPGTNADGATFIADAQKNGASRIVCTEQSKATAINLGYKEDAIFTYSNAREAIWQLAREYYQTHTLPFKIVGITGTNGKTTSAALLEHLFQKLGFKVAVMGTINERWPGHLEIAQLTTPDALQIHANLASMREAKVDILFMEVSSHALAQERVGGLNFNAALFSNLTQDHLDFHSSMQDYFQAKLSLFNSLPLADKKMAINADDSWGQKILEQNPSALAYGFQEIKNKPKQRQITAQILKCSVEGLHLAMHYADIDKPSQEWQLKSPLVGNFNASNLLAVQALALELGVTIPDLQILGDFHGVCGRMERVANPQNLHIFVDYAHTPDALSKAIFALRAANFEKIIVLFGCGGNRDRTKRPLMGEAVAASADVAILTSDNPRFEDPEAIIKDVLPGLKNAKQTVIEVDRRKATEKALQILAETTKNQKSALLIAGKGHEDYQIIQGIKHHYSDQETVRELLGCV